MILVFGSVNVDLVMSVSSLPKPGETVLTEECRQMPGGKGANQAFAAHRAGAETVFVGSVGADGHAELALSLLKIFLVSGLVIATSLYLIAYWLLVVKWKLIRSSESTDRLQKT